MLTHCEWYILPPSGNGGEPSAGAKLPPAGLQPGRGQRQRQRQGQRPVSRAAQPPAGSRRGAGAQGLMLTLMG